MGMDSVGNSKKTNKNAIAKLSDLMKQSTVLSSILVLFLISLVFTVLSPYFLSVDNIINVTRQSAVSLIVATGMSFVIISGGIDLSVGSMVALSGCILGGSLINGIGIMWIAIPLGILMGTFLGFVNGFIVTQGNMPHFIVTLGMMSVARGFALLYTKGESIPIRMESFRWIGGGDIFNVITIPVLIAIMVLILGNFVLSKTKIGRYTYAIGGSEKGAYMSGISIFKYKTLVYVISGMCCGVASVVTAARLGSAQPTAGWNFELDAIAACVIGGISLSGGEGKIAGTMIGALIMGVIRNGLNLLNVGAFLQQIAVGSIIIIAVVLDRLRKRQSR